MFNEIVRDRAIKFKQLFYNTIQKNDERIKQDEIAFELKTTQESISNYINPTSNSNLPAFQIKYLPRDIRIPIINDFIADLGARVVLFSGTMKLDGRIDDEILLIGMLEGKLIEHKDRPAEEINKILDQVQIAVDRMRLEVSEKKK